MPAIYSAVARGPAVLAEYAVLAGNFSAVARDYLAKAGGVGAWSSSSAPSSPSSAAAANGGNNNSSGTRSTYTVDGHLFSFLADQDGFTYVIVTDEASGRALPGALLDKIRAEWAAKGYPEKVKQQAAQAARDAAAAIPPPAPGRPLPPPPPPPPPAPVPAFARRLKEAMEHATQFPEQYGRVAAVQARVDEVKAVMSDNIEKVLARGEKLDVLVDKTDGLMLEADRFVKGGRALRRRMRCQNIKSKMMMGGAVTMVVVILFLLMCYSGGRNCFVSRASGGKGGEAAGAGAGGGAGAAGAGAGGASAAAPAAAGADAAAVAPPPPGP